MPVLPIVHSVSDAEFAVHLPGAHFHVQVHALLEQEIVVAAIEEPRYRAQFFEGGFVGIVEIIQRRMLPYGLAYQV